MAGVDGRNRAERPLKSWKEIAAFFGRDERTVKRWEASRGLPVHRLPGRTRASIYAYPSELENWLTGNRDAEAAGSPITRDEPVDASPAPAVMADARTDSPPVSGEHAARPQAAAMRWRRRAFLTGAGVVIITLAAGYAAVPLAQDYLMPRAMQGRERLSQDAAARDLYLSGKYQLALRTGPGLKRAIQLFTEAIAHDPEFAAAYAGLAKGYNLLSQYTDTPAEEAYPLARAAGDRALKLDRNLPAAYASLAFTSFYWDRDFDRSRTLFEKALALDPDSAEANHWFALTVVQTADFDTALKAIRHAQELDPDSRAILANKALILYHAGDIDEAGKLLRQFAETAPEYPAPHFYLADLYFDQERYREAIEQALIAANITGNDGMRIIYEAARQGFDRAGRTGLLEGMLAEQKRQNEDGRVPAYKLARTLALLDETDQALTYLALSVAEREPDSLGIRIDSAFRELHNDGRFRALMVKAGHVLPEAGEPVAVATDQLTTGTEAPR
ncbi:tetratricopeptide repeat protein [Mesorhizobium yinganensis]|uniref:tetratricopeptide repeat protein n=1 Tax=Mesorhizobium yinganensis TaxID=3157707 RepID=UPI0032B7478F